jgi:hypothetical protein
MCRKGVQEAFDDEID